MLVAISRHLAEEVNLGRRDALIVPQSSEGSFAAACPLSVLWSLHHVAHAPSLSFSAVS